MNLGKFYKKSLLLCLNKAITEGYRTSFKVTGAVLTYGNAHTSYRPDQVEIIDAYRFEENADPADNAVLYVMKTSDGTRGTLIDACGIYANPMVLRFIDCIRKLSKGKQAGFSTGLK